MAYQMMHNHVAAAQQAHYLYSLAGRSVKINRGGPDAMNGRLLAVRSNYLVLKTKKGVVYINADHVKSITEAAGGSGGRSASYVIADSFHGVLRQLRNQFVQINQGGPEKVEGFIADVTGDTLLLVAGREVIRIPLFHIRSVSLAERKGSKSGGNSNSNSNSNSSDSNSSKSGGNKSGGNKSSGNKSGGNKSGGSHSRDGRSGGNRAAGAQGGKATAQARAVRKPLGRRGSR